MRHQTTKKKNSRVVKEIQQTQRQVDDTVMEIASKDDEFHDELGDLHNTTMKKMRLRILSIKKENGGLNREEKQELILLEGF